MAEETDRVAEWIRRAALHYLERYASSEANLRRVLARKLRRRQAADERFALEEADAATLIASTVEHCRRLGFVDDAVFAEMRVAGGRRKGLSRTKIVTALAAKGVPREVAAEAVAAGPSDDETAALVFARRRRLGPFRDGSRRREDQDRRDVAALCRQGFALSLARRVVAMDHETAEAALAAG